LLLGVIWRNFLRRESIGAGVVGVEIVVEGGRPRQGRRRGTDLILDLGRIVGLRGRLVGLILIQIQILRVAFGREMSRLLIRVLDTLVLSFASRSIPLKLDGIFFQYVRRELNQIDRDDLIMTPRPSG